MTNFSKRDALLAFIECYRSLPELWDTECASYSNRVKKAAAYDILIEKLKPLEPDATRESVVKKINNIRCVFRKELKKVNDSKKSGNVYVPSLWYFSELMFLVDQETLDPHDSTPPPMCYLWTGMGNENNDNSGQPYSPSTSSASISAASSFTTSNRKRKPFPSSNDFLTKAMQYLEAEDDDCLILAQGYAVKLRKLTTQQLMFADRVINEALLDAQMGLLSRNSYIVHSTGPPSSS